MVRFRSRLRKIPLRGHRVIDLPLARRGDLPREHVPELLDEALDELAGVAQGGAGEVVLVAEQLLGQGHRGRQLPSELGVREQLAQVHPVDEPLFDPLQAGLDLGDGHQARPLVDLVHRLFEVGLGHLGAAPRTRRGSTSPPAAPAARAAVQRPGRVATGALEGADIGQPLAVLGRRDALAAHLAEDVQHRLEAQDGPAQRIVAFHRIVLARRHPDEGRERLVLADDLVDRGPRVQRQLRQLQIVDDLPHHGLDPLGLRLVAEGGRERAPVDELAPR